MDKPLLSHQEATQGAALGLASDKRTQPIKSFWCCNAPKTEHGGEPKFTVLVKGEVGHCFKNVMKQKEKPYTSILEVEGEDELYSVWVVDRERMQVTHHITTYGVSFWPAENKAHLITRYNREELLYCRGEPQTKGGDKARRPKPKPKPRPLKKGGRKPKSSKPVRPKGKKGATQKVKVYPTKTMSGAPPSSTGLTYSQAPTRTATTVHRNAPHRKENAYGITLTHAEPLGGITIGTVPTAFVLSAFTIQPGSFGEARYIGEESERWTWWRAHWIKIIWQTYLGTTTNARVHMAVSLSSAEPPPASLSDMEQMEGYFSESAWKSFEMHVDTKNMQKALATRLIRNGPVVDNLMYDGGVLYVHVSGGEASTQMGVVRTSYSIDMSIARTLNAPSIINEPNFTDTLDSSTSIFPSGATYSYNPDQIKSLSEGVTVDGEGGFVLPEGSWQVVYSPQFKIEDTGIDSFITGALTSKITASADSATPAETFVTETIDDGAQGDSVEGVVRGIVNVANGATRTVKAASDWLVFLGDTATTLQPLGDAVVEISQLFPSFSALSTLLLLQIQDNKTGRRYYRHPQTHIDKMIKPDYDPSAETVIRGQHLLEELLIQETTTEVTAQELADIKIEELRQELLAAEGGGKEAKSVPTRLSEALERKRPTAEELAKHRERRLAVKQAGAEPTFDQLDVGGVDVLIRLSPQATSVCYKAVKGQLEAEGHVISSITDIQPQHNVWHVLRKVPGPLEAYEGHLQRSPVLSPDCHPGYKPRLLGTGVTDRIVSESGFPQSSEPFSC